MGPIDYTQDIQSPFQAGLQGFVAGDAIRSQMDARAQAEQAAIQKQQQQQQLQELLGGIANNPNATADDYARVMTLRPELSEKLQKAWATKSEAQQKGELSFRGQVFTALNSNQPEVAADLLKKRAAAKRAQGMEEEAAQDEMVANTIAYNPSVARLSAGTWLAATPGGKEILEQSQKLRVAPAEERKLEADATAAEAGAVAAEADATIKKEQAAVARQTVLNTLAKSAEDLKLTKAQARLANASASKMDAETAAALAAAKEGGSPKDRFDAEMKLRKEYSAQTQPFVEVIESHRRMKSAGDSGPGDIAMIFSYMKMLDPGSVVREGEFATAQNSGGIPSAIQNIYNRAMNGERLTAGQRATFLGQANALAREASKREEEVRTGLATVARSYKLDESNVFGSRAKRDPADVWVDTPATPPKPPGATRGNTEVRNW